jgi:hypothetical protein
MIPRNIDKLNDVGLYTFKDDENANIELSFHIETPGDYKITLTGDDIKTFEKMNFINKRLKFK